MKRYLVAGAMALSGLAVLSPTAAEAGDQAAPGVITVNVEVRAPGADDLLADLVVELYNAGTGTLIPGACSDLAGITQERTITWSAGSSCSSLGFGDYHIGIAGVPSGYDITATCFPSATQEPERISDGEGGFIGANVNVEEPLWDCDIFVSTSVVVIDKAVNNGRVGTATSSDFVLEVYDAAGALVASGIDPATGLCELGGDNLDACLVIAAVADPGYQLGEVLPDYGYAFDGAECQSFLNVEVPTNEGRERFAAGIGEFDLDDGDAYCVVSNSFQQGPLDVDVVVINDNGGTATAADVQIEIFRTTDGAQVGTATACAADGNCIDTLLPIGEYAIGYIGPNGYTRTVAQTVVQRELERITDDPDATFTIAAAQAVQLVVTIDDPIPPTTTTTTTTTTTLAPTTTAFDSGSITLPPTGSSSSQTTTLALVATVLVLSGTGLLLVRRRSA